MALWFYKTENMKSPCLEMVAILPHANRKLALCCGSFSLSTYVCVSVFIVHINHQLSNNRIEWKRGCNQQIISNWKCFQESIYYYRSKTFVLFRFCFWVSVNVSLPQIQWNKRKFIGRLQNSGRTAWAVMWDDVIIWITASTKIISMPNSKNTFISI